MEKKKYIKENVLRDAEINKKQLGVDLTHFLAAYIYNCHEQKALYGLPGLVYWNIAIDMENRFEIFKKNNTKPYLHGTQRALRMMIKITQQGSKQDKTDLDEVIEELLEIPIDDNLLP
ncbi:MAG: hypothetical protein U9R08_01430 [Nanoarchaeota archaeon]|nr:hypothetical protein [Nanoarchaeota archaeon]